MAPKTPKLPKFSSLKSILSLLKKSHQLLCGFGDVEGALDDLLCDKTLVEWLALRAHDQNPALSLEVRGRSRKG